MEIGAIPWSSVMRYYDINGWGDRGVFYEIIRLVDNEYLQAVKERG